MSSKVTETFSTTLLALSLAIQVTAPLYAQSEAVASNGRARLVTRLTPASNLISKKDDDGDDDDDDDDHEKERQKAKDENSKNDSGDRTNPSTSGTKTKADTSNASDSSDSPQSISSEKTDADSSSKTDQSQKSTSSGEHNSTPDANKTKSGDTGSSETKTAVPSWNDSSESRSVNQKDVKTNSKKADDKSDKSEKVKETGPDHKADRPNSVKSTDSKSATGKTSAAQEKNQEVHSTKLPGKPPEGLPPSFYIDAKYCRKVIEDVDAQVCKRLYSKKLAQTAWKDGLKKNREAILNSKTLRDLYISMGAAMAELKSSHCSFVTINDEMYHFLHALFSDFNKKLSKGKVDYVGFVTGGSPFEEKQIRYILDGSPAVKAGLQIGDRIQKVNGHPYMGYINFLDTAGRNITLSIERKGETKSITIKPEKDDLYAAYTEAMKKSVRVEQIDGKKIGYVHVWSGGRRSFEALDEILENKLGNTDGLIFDIRDGYGGNSLSDLDRFYRSPKAYPDFKTVDRNGKQSTSRYYYDKPIVVIINGGSRSGKELLSFSFKRTGRAKLVGTNTAGAVLAGSLSKIDDKTSLYLAVLDGTVDGVRLEGVGVAPDVVIDNTSHDQAGYEKQLSVARETLLEQLKK